MTAIEAALKAIDYEKTLEHGNYVPPVYVFRAVNERNATDPFSYGYEMFLLGVAKGRRMEKTARKAIKCADVERQCYIDAIVRLLEKADLEALELIWIAARNLTRKKATSDEKTH